MHDDDEIKPVKVITERVSGSKSCKVVDQVSKGRNSADEDFLCTVQSDEDDDFSN
jgi:hypothetical protein